MTDSLEQCCCCTIVDQAFDISHLAGMARRMQSAGGTTTVHDDRVSFGSGGGSVKNTAYGRSRDGFMNMGCGPTVGGGTGTTKLYPLGVLTGDHVEITVSTTTIISSVVGSQTWQGGDIGGSCCVWKSHDGHTYLRVFQAAGYIMARCADPGDNRDWSMSFDGVRDFNVYAANTSPIDYDAAAHKDGGACGGCSGGFCLTPAMSVGLTLTGMTGLCDGMGGSVTATGNGRCYWQSGGDPYAGETGWSMQYYYNEDLDQTTVLVYVTVLFQGTLIAGRTMSGIKMPSDIEGLVLSGDDIQTIPFGCEASVPVVTIGAFS